MPKVTSKSPIPSSPQPEEEEKPFDQVTTKDKVLYVISKTGIFAFFPQYQSKIDKWNPQWVQTQNKKELQNAKTLGIISDLTAIKVGLFIAMAGLIVGAVFAAPLLGIGILTLIGIGLNTLLLTALLYNLILLMKAPLDQNWAYLEGIDKIVEDCIKELEGQRTPEQVQWEIDKAEHVRRQEAKENGEEGIEMEQMNAPQNYIDPAMIPVQDPALAEQNQSYIPQVNGPEIDLDPMNDPQNLPPLDTAPIATA
jgi:hypothetical protein